MLESKVMKIDKMVLAQKVFLGVMSLCVFYWWAYMLEPSKEEWEAPAEVAEIWDQKFLKESEGKIVDSFGFIETETEPIIGQFGDVALFGPQNRKIIAHTKYVYFNRETILMHPTAVKSPGELRYSGKNIAPVYLKAQTVSFNNVTLRAPMYIDAEYLDVYDRTAFLNHFVTVSPQTKIDILY
jgi:hypothetical protein